MSHIGNKYNLLPSYQSSTSDNPTSNVKGSAVAHKSSSMSLLLNALSIGARGKAVTEIVRSSVSSAEHHNSKNPTRPRFASGVPTSIDRKNGEDYEGFARRRFEASLAARGITAENSPAINADSQKILTDLISKGHTPTVRLQQLAYSAACHKHKVLAPGEGLPLPPIKSSYQKPQISTQKVNRSDSASTVQQSRTIARLDPSLSTRW